MVVKYSDMIRQISESTGISYHRVRLIVKESSTVYQDAIKEGKDIDTGIFKIIYTLPGGMIYKNKEVGWEEMEREVYARTGLSYGDVKLVLTQYLTMLTNYVKNGQAVTVKGVGYLYPEVLEDSTTDIDYRIAPSLTKRKSDGSEFVVMNNGVMEVAMYSAESLRLSMSVNLLS